MTRQDELIRDAIIRANKLGAKGIEVTGFAQPDDATQRPDYYLITQSPELTDASESAWYDK